MKLYKLKDRWLPAHYPQSVKKGKLEYFERGRGYSKTKVFEEVEVADIPDAPWTWLDVARAYDQYGKYVATYMAERLTAILIAAQTARGYHAMYQIVKSAAVSFDDHEFFALLKCNYLMALMGHDILDVVVFDKQLGKLDADYDPQAATYKGVPTSLRSYIGLKWGDKYVDIVDALSKID